VKANMKQYRQAQLRALEWEVKLYHTTKEELAIVKEDIILATGQHDQGMPKQTEVSDTTGRIALRLLSDPQVREMERRINAIERAKNEFCAKDTEVKLKFVHLRFWNNTLTNEGIALRLGIGTTTVYEWRNKFLLLVGNYLGWRL
jgi:RinA family phage transcriptional activator